MNSLTLRMIQYMKVQGLAFSTIKEYSKQCDAIIKKHPDYELWDASKCITHLSAVNDPITRSNIRNIHLKVHRDMLGKNIVLPFIKKPTRLQGIYTQEEVKKIFAQIHNAKHYAIGCLLYVEGFRVGEVIGILKSDCNKADKSIFIRSTKNGKDYKKYLDDTTIKALENYCSWLKERRFTLNKYLFEGCCNNQYSKRSIQEFMRSAIKKAGLPIKGSCHVFRRSSSVWKIESGWSLQHIASSLNNTSKTVAKYYALVRPDYIKLLPKPSII